MSWSTKQVILDECLKYLDNPTIDTESILWSRLKQYLRNTLNLHKDTHSCVLCLHPELRDFIIRRFKLSIPLERTSILKQDPTYIEFQLKNQTIYEYLEDLLVARLLFN